MPSLEYEWNGRTRKLELSPEQEYYIGRDPECAVCLDGIGKVSRRHCIIYYNRNNKCYTLADMYSTNGTGLNGRKIGRNDVFLHDKDEIQVGPVRFQFLMPEILQTQSISTASTKLPLISTQPLSRGKINNETLPGNELYQLGDRIGEYQISRIISENEYRAIYLLEDGSQSSICKVFKELPSDFSAGKDLIRTIAKLKTDLPGLIPYQDCGSLDNGLCYYTLPFREEPSYAQLISVMAPLHENKAIPLLYSVALLLYKMEQMGMIHGDLNPGNLFFVSKAGNSVEGYGISEWQQKYFPEYVKRPRQWYAAPEVTAGEKATWQSDLYSLGIIMFQMLTGVLPFRSDSAEELAAMHRNQPLPLPRERNSQVTVSPPVCGILTRMTMKDPAKRHSSWKDLLAALEKVNNQLTKQENMSNS